MAACGDIATTLCLQCESAITFKVTRGRKPCYCSAACRQELYRRRREGLIPPSANLPRRPRTKRQPHPCEYCGETTQRPRFCSVKCSQVARDRRRGIAERKKPQIRQCVVCFSEFSWISRGDRDAGKCCTRECGFELRRQRGERTRAWTTAREEFARWARRARARQRPTRPEIVKTCRECRAEVGKGKQRCEPCRDRHAKLSRVRFKRTEAYRAARRAAKARRRAIERGTEAERFDPFEVFQRDGWRCHMCGRSTPQRLRGTFKPNAPELDHIVPLAKGGKHTRANTACACRSCNGNKADRIIGQPSLLSLAA